MCGDYRAALRCPGWAQATARAARRALTAPGGRRGIRQGLALSVSLCGPGRATTERVPFFSSKTSARREIPTRNHPELANRARPRLCGRGGIARLSLSVHWPFVIRAEERVIDAVLRELRLAGLLGQRVLPVFFPIGHRGGATAFTLSGAAFEISRPPPPSRAPGPISQKSLSWHGIQPPLGSSCTPRPSGQYVPMGQKPI
jgi:hypothetical protein